MTFWGRRIGVMIMTETNKEMEMIMNKEMD